MSEKEIGKKNSIWVIVLTAAITLIITGTIASLSGYLGPKSMVGDSGQMSSSKKKESKPQLYSCGMHPTVISEEPGKCPL